MQLCLGHCQNTPEDIHISDSLRKASMCLHNQIPWHSSLALQAIDILSEQLQQQSLLVKQVYKRVCDCRSEFPRIQLLRKRVERFWLVAEVRYVEHSLGVGKIEAGEIGIQARFWRSEVWYACRSTYTRAYLLQSVPLRGKATQQVMPTMTTIFCAFPSRTYRANASIVRELSVRGGVFGSTMVDSSLPILPRLSFPRPL